MAPGAGSGRRRRIERGLLRRPRPRTPRPPSCRRLPRRPVLAAAGRGGAPLPEGSAAVGRRRGGGGCVDQRRPTRRVFVRGVPAVAGHSAPRGGRRAAERPAGVRVRVSPSRISHDRKLEAVSRKGAFTAELPCAVPRGTWVRGAAGRESAAAELSWASVYTAGSRPPRGSCRRTLLGRGALAWGRACCSRNPRDAAL